MRRFIFALLLAGLVLPFQAQARLFTQPELDALVAPIALYPDGLISDILVAATYPDQVDAAARLPKDAQPEESWDPSVKSLLSFPDILQRMVESPQWTRDLGEAFLGQEPHVLDTVQALRRRAQQQGTLKSNDQQVVTQEGSAIVVQPRTEIVYAPYYDPLVVYGGWWWPAYYPVYWRPWVVAPAFVGVGFWYATPVWHHRHVVVNKHWHGTWHGHSHSFVATPVNGRLNAAANLVHHGSVRSQPYTRVPESQRRPIVSSTPQMHRFDEHRSRSGDARGNDWRGGERRSGGERQQRPEGGQRSYGGGQDRRSHSMPAAPRFSEHRAPQRQQRAPSAPQQRAAVPQQQPRMSAPPQYRGGGEMRSNGGGRGNGHGNGGGSRSAGNGGGRGGRG